MFTPNMRCLIAPNSARNLYGEDVPGTPFPEGCALVSLKTEAKATNSRAQLAGSMEHAEDLGVTASIMLTAATKAKLGDQLTIAGQVLRIVSMEPQISTMGVLDHYLAGGTPWV
ncbi:hypothetical protein AB6809_29320 [Paraburkholderia sp. RCC_158]|uniref:hypothetical protein n=1 Tax=Paraburkholderia sp. RCC_158 TaxID=3239220 RepID=UPI0035242985